MKYTENAINILTTKTFKGIGRAWIVKNLKGNESIEEIIQLLNIQKVLRLSYNLFQLVLVPRMLK